MTWLHPAIMIFVYSLGLVALGVEGMLAVRRPDRQLRAFFLFHVLYTVKIVLSGLVVVEVAGLVPGFALPDWFPFLDWSMFGLMVASLVVFLARAESSSDEARALDSVPFEAESAGSRRLAAPALLLLLPNIVLWLTPWPFPPEVDQALFLAFPLTYLVVTIIALLSALKTQPQAADRQALLADFAKGHGLSERETEVTLRLLGGKSNARIAEELYVSIHTVKRHVYNIFKKTGATSRLDLVRRVEQSG